MRSRFLPLALALASACAFALAVSNAWWTVAEVSIGPFGGRRCFSGECADTSLAWTGGSEMWMRAASAARAGGYIAMFLLIVVAGALAAKRVPRLMVRSALVAILTSIAGGTYFVFACPAIPEAHVSAGMFLYFGAVVVGIAAVITTLRLPEPSDQT